MKRLLEKENKMAVKSKYLGIDIIKPSKEAMDMRVR
jgi:hypothetical protein